VYKGCRGPVVKASGWPSFDRQFEVRTLPPRVIGGALAVWPGTLMVEYINKWDFIRQTREGAAGNENFPHKMAASPGSGGARIRR
jgi:hypothetical protein